MRWYKRAALSCTRTILFSVLSRKQLNELSFLILNTIVNREKQLQGYWFEYLLIIIRIHLSGVCGVKILFPLTLAYGDTAWACKYFKTLTGSNYFIFSSGSALEKELQGLFDIKNQIIEDQFLSKVFEYYQRRLDKKSLLLQIIKKEISEKNEVLFFKDHDATLQRLIDRYEGYGGIPWQEVYITHRAYYEVFKESVPQAVDVKSSDRLLSELRIEGKYVCLHIRESLNDRPNPRSIRSPERYIQAMERLIERGYQVVLMGKIGFRNDSNPYEKFPTKTFIHYYRSSYQSIENDFHLISRANFIIGNCSGIAGIAFVYRVPLLSLDTSILAFAFMLEEHRYYPKTYVRSGYGELKPQEYFESSCLYDQQGDIMKNEGIEFLDLKEEQVVEAVDEFESLVSKGTEAFKSYSPRQNDYRRLARREHFFLYQSKAVPLNCYLERFDSLNAPQREDVKCVRSGLSS